MQYSDTERINWLIDNRLPFITREPIDLQMNAAKYLHKSHNLLAPDKDPYNDTRTGPISRNSQEVTL